MSIKDLIWEFENGSISSYKLVEKLKEIQVDLKEVSSEDLRQELELRGWYTQNLWHVDDVMQNYDCASEDAMRVLDFVLTSDHVTEEVFRGIDDQAEYSNIKRKDNE